MSKLITNSVIISILIISCWSCRSKNREEEFNKDKSFGNVQDLSTFKQSGFLPTLESPIEKDKNNIYCASLLLCWDHLKEKISGPYTNITNEELLRMENSKTFQHVLHDSEYVHTITIKGASISSKVLFKKSLPFKLPFEKDSVSFKFDNHEVASFGFAGDNYNNRADILYYTNDNDFSIRLHAKDSLHEIVFIKSHFDAKTTLGSEIEKLSGKIKSFNDARNDENGWKYYFTELDEVKIPMIEFNLETNYKNIEGSGFTSRNGSSYSVDMVYQRIAFLLNEKGAIVETKAEVVVKEAPPPDEQKRPKKMFLNKPFIVLLKKADQKYPYFCMLVSNAELMKPFQPNK